MSGVLILILLGLVLIIWGTKAFWGLLFISLGLYIFYVYFKAFKRKNLQKEILKKSMVKIIEENNPEEAADIISRKIKYPLGTKFVISVKTDETNVNLVFPLGILIATKPLLYSIKPIIKKYMKHKNKENDESSFDFDPIFNILIESIEYLPDYYGDFIDVEADGGKTRVKIYVV